jgi:hypothetical protein
LRVTLIRGRVLALTRQTPPAELGISHWSAAKMAAWIRKTEGVPVSQPWVSRLWREHGLQPWRQGTFKISNDPLFEEKVRDVTGLYLNPPEDEAVVSVDAKTGIQALDQGDPQSRFRMSGVGWLLKVAGFADAGRFGGEAASSWFRLRSVVAWVSCGGRTAERLRARTVTTGRRVAPV